MKLSSLWVKNCYGWDTGTVREPWGRGTSVVGSRYQRTGVDTADRGDSVRAVVIWTVCEIGQTMHFHNVIHYWLVNQLHGGASWKHENCYIHKKLSPHPIKPQDWIPSSQETASEIYPTASYCLLWSMHYSSVYAFVIKEVFCLQVFRLIFWNHLRSLKTPTFSSCVGTQELHTILWNKNVQKNSPLVPILSQINPMHTTTNYLRYMLTLSNYLHLGLSSGLFLLDFPPIS
jgi:hypothetical protein